MRSNDECTRYHGGQLDGSTCGRHNFFIWTMFEVFLIPLERPWSVELCEGSQESDGIFYPLKHDLDPKTGPRRYWTPDLQSQTDP